jgi:thioredoxin 1
MITITDVTDSTFESEVLKSELPVLVDFWAPWCGPCMMMGPVIEAVASKLSGQVKFCKLNTDSNIQTAQTYEIMAIPTLLVFKGGAKVDRMIGVQPPDQLEKRLQGFVQAPATAPVSAEPSPEPSKES